VIYLPVTMSETTSSSSTMISFYMVDFYSQDNVGDYGKVEWIQLLVMGASVPYIQRHSKQIGSPPSKSTCYCISYLCDLPYWKLFCDDMTSQQSKGEY